MFCLISTADADSKLPSSRDSVSLFSCSDCGKKPILLGLSPNAFNELSCICECDLPRMPLSCLILSVLMLSSVSEISASAAHSF
jgi:hypothetical protein